MPIDVMDFETGTAYWQIVSDTIMVWRDRGDTDQEGITIEIEDMEFAIAAYRKLKPATGE